ncbi:cytochrome c biogenesis protein ResB [Aureibacter tunicatorum]|uniref:ResB-like domain-containing protein n=1 Tax=Aureibacter tunicatorum TaxID=866807 RepID=A0AAE3XML3_9BACT|nr:cytochrome c biogenesis protein ResB [Aureibacter tunicatorum]MDR6239227.1 hypothetical protein [Aureibacter tunicatorum]BDD04848.1 membrane protein [Aureibacter tunicatorum]
MNNSKQKTRKIWTFPWGYREGFVLSAGLMLLGLALELATHGAGVPTLRWPVNIIFGLLFSAFLATLYFLNRKNPIIKWLSGVPATITSIILIGVIVTVMGILPQAPEEHPSIISLLKLNNVTDSWYFTFAVLYFMSTLGFACCKRVIPFKGKNIGFLLNHLGLYIALMSAMLGAGDLIRLTADLYKGNIEWRAKDANGILYELPIAMRLDAFSIDQYNPKVAIINKDGMLLPQEKPQLQLIDSAGQSMEILDWKVSIMKFDTLSKPFAGRYEPVNEEGAAPSAKIKAVNIKNGKEKEGWISCGSFMVLPEGVELDSTHTLVMTAPEPKKYQSKIHFITKSGLEEDGVIEVNKPYKIDGWNVYQLSYDEQFGRWSRLSVVELVKDPWLPAVYVGVFMMLFGSIYIMWVGNNFKSK